MRQAGWASLLAVGLVSVAAFAADSDVPVDFPTIQLAIDAGTTVAGDTITVSVSPHTEETIHVDKSVTIEGLGLAATTVRCRAGGAGGIGFYIDADDVTLQDMTITNCSQAVRFEMAGGTIDNTDFLRVRMSANTSRGIEVHNNTTVTNLLAQDCEFVDTNTGLRVSSSGHLDGADFIDSLFDDNVIGIYEANDGGTSTMSDLLVSGCTFSNHADPASTQDTAIFLEEIQNALIVDNLFVDNERDFQIFKWYQPSVKVSDVLMTRNLHLGTSSRGVFTLFNAENQGGRTEFDGVVYTDNVAITSDGTGVFAGAHLGPGAGGTGWDTVHINCNDFENITTPGRGVLYFDPNGDPPNALGGAELDVEFNYWETDKLAPTTALMDIPEITDYVPFLTAPHSNMCPEGDLEVVLESFTGEVTDEGVVLRWTTSAEIDNAGFRIARAKVGRKTGSSYEIVSTEMIRPRGSEVEGADYEYLDASKTGGGTLYYFLEDIDTSGRVSRHGPVTVVIDGTQTRVRPMRKR